MRGKQHLFVFGTYRGVLHYDAGRPELSRVEMTFDAGSAECKDTWLSAKDLKKVQEFAQKEMFDSEHHPVISFRSAQIRAMADGRYEVAGALTIRNITKPSTAVVSIQQGAGKELSFEGTSVVRLTDYGLKPPTAALGLVGTKNEMTLSFTLAASPAQ
jgi:polyisoprenoid-binding protein YceI